MKAIIPETQRKYLKIKPNLIKMYNAYILHYDKTNVSLD